MNALKLFPVPSYLEKNLRLLFIITTIGAALMPSVPEATDFRALLVAGAAWLLLMVWTIERLYIGSVFYSLAGSYLLFFLVCVGLSLFIALLWGTDFALWLRGAIPFLFLAIFFPAFELARKDSSWVLHVIGVGAIVWLLATITGSFNAASLVLQGEAQRITHVTEAWSAFQLPYAMIGLAIMLFHPPVRAAWIRWPLAVAFTMLPLLAVSRGQILAVLGLWGVYVFRQRKRGGLKAAVIALMILAGFSVLLLSSNLWVSISERFSETTTGESSRVAELSYAWEQFLESPIFGKGLGHQIPAEVTFLGHGETIMQAGVESVGYMHNVVGYLLMDLGLLGFGSYIGFVFVPLYQGWMAWRYNKSSSILPAAILALLSLISWFIVQASFRQIQSNLLLASLVAVLATNKVRRTVPAHA